MISFSEGQHRFNFRVAGIAIDENQVLLHRLGKDDFWSFPGGRIELGETSQEALSRELKEEINAIVEPVRLLWVVEDFFDYNHQHYHELGFYYLMRLPERSPYLDKKQVFYGVEKDKSMEFKWFPVEQNILNSLPLLPAFLQSALSDLPNAVEHISRSLPKTSY